MVFVVGIVTFEYSAERVFAYCDYEARLTFCVYLKSPKAIWVRT